MYTRKYYSTTHDASEAAFFLSLFLNMLDHRGWFDGILAHRRIEDFSRTHWDHLAWGLTRYVIPHIVEDYADVVRGQETFYVTAWTTRVEFRFLHNSNNQAIAPNWVSGATLARMCKFSQLSAEEQRVSKTRFKTPIFDLMLLLHGWEGYFGYHQAFRCEESEFHLEIPEGFC